MNRVDFAKLIGGASFAILFTATVFGPLGFGPRYADDLQRRVKTALEDRQIERVQVSVERSPALRRSVVLTGDVSERDRHAAIEVSRDVTGVAEVRWADTPGGGGGASSPGLSARYP